MVEADLFMMIVYLGVVKVGSFIVVYSNKKRYKYTYY